ncbi:uncharacterized protein LOC106871567 [Octopus bimaculoides]|uniref:Chondroitin proteoglycan 4 domain-containing protein n=1 Tax=Octopus bimaculoides TaxID=37653 RepID=A0A0L8HCJ5_OCTBM|nr:uncharacterized protein LOC106871567 [Octopus bimaculoides]|eukprot:XP_014773559.1 PREDICTED: uncharacterized protein LOC106871567 [Octopus bimaculoides]
MNPNDLLRTEINNLSRSQMKELCQIFYNFKDCVEEELKPCMDKDEFEKILEAFEESFNYICHEGFELLMKIKPCTSSANFKDHMSQCSYDAQYKVNRHNVRLMNDYMMKMKVCRYLEESLECAETVAQKLCGNDAQKYYHELNVRTMGPAKRFLRCHQARNTTLIGLGISIALVLAIVVLVIGRCLRRHQMVQEASSETLLIPGILQQPLRRQRMGATTTTAAAATANASTTTGPTAMAAAAAAAAMASPPYTPRAQTSTDPSSIATDIPDQIPKDLPPQYPGHPPYPHSCTNDKDDYTTPPPSYEQVMAEMRNRSEEQ